jgi:hypothetical protein
MLTKGSEYVDRGRDDFEERYRQRVMHHLKRKAAAMGFILQPAETVENCLVHSVT